MPHYSLPHKRIPAATVLDVAGFFRTFTTVPCPAYVHPRFLRQAAEILAERGRLELDAKVAGVRDLQLLHRP